MDFEHDDPGQSSRGSGGRYLDVHSEWKCEDFELDTWVVLRYRHSAGQVDCRRWIKRRIDGIDECDGDWETLGTVADEVREHEGTGRGEWDVDDGLGDRECSEVQDWSWTARGDTDDSAECTSDDVEFDIGRVIQHRGA